MLRERRKSTPCLTGARELVEQLVKDLRNLSQDLKDAAEEKFTPSAIVKRASVEATITANLLENKFSTR